mmetsp:Transcript_18885/g.34147  ORF Transcript_18885/g.34147 Transcript_18885/m.34147 type:complete len:227 (+) Transcript_18885:66-746(+)
MWGAGAHRRPVWHSVLAISTIVMLVCGVARHASRRQTREAFVPIATENSEALSRRSSLGLGIATALGATPLALGEDAWAADGNPFPYDKSRGKIAKKLAAFTGDGCPDPLIQVALGPAGDQLRFVPDQLNLVQGCYFELALSNPSELEHNFVALEFSKAVYTVVVLAGSPPAEIKGPVTELELKPGASLGWFLVPVKSGDFQLKCTVAGHTEGGMVGKVMVAPRTA